LPDLDRDQLFYIALVNGAWQLVDIQTASSSDSVFMWKMAFSNNTTIVTNAQLIVQSIGMRNDTPLLITLAKPADAVLHAAADASSMYCAIIKVPIYTGHVNKDKIVISYCHAFERANAVASGGGGIAYINNDTAWPENTVPFDDACPNVTVAFKAIE
jgi:hypothetical protein